MGVYVHVSVLETFRTSSGELSCSRAVTKSLISLLSTFTFNLGQDQWNNNTSKQQVCLYVKGERGEIIFLDLNFYSLWMGTQVNCVLTFPWLLGLPFLLE